MACSISNPALGPYPARGGGVIAAGSAAIGSPPRSRSARPYRPADAGVLDVVDQPDLAPDELRQPDRRGVAMPQIERRSSPQPTDPPPTAPNAPFASGSPAAGPRSMPRTAASKLVSKLPRLGLVGQSAFSAACSPADRCRCWTRSAAANTSRAHTQQSAHTPARTHLALGRADKTPPSRPRRQRWPDHLTQRRRGWKAAKLIQHHPVEVEAPQAVGIVPPHTARTLAPWRSRYIARPRAHRAHLIARHSVSDRHRGESLDGSQRPPHSQTARGGRRHRGSQRSARVDQVTHRRQGLARPGRCETMHPPRRRRVKPHQRRPGQNSRDDHVHPGRSEAQTGTQPSHSQPYLLPLWGRCHSEPRSGAMRMTVRAPTITPSKTHNPPPDSSARTR